MRRKVTTLAQFTREIGELPATLEAAVKRGMRNTARRGVAVVREEIRRDGLEDTGALLASVRTRGPELVVDAPHAAHMEYGTKPHFPPIEPIFLWVMRKGLASSEKEGRRIAFAICKLIAERGTLPRWYFRRAMRRIRADILPGEIAKELAAL